MQDSNVTVVEGSSESADFLEADMGFYFFWNGSAVFAQLSGNGFKTVLLVEQGFDENPVFEF